MKSITAAEFQPADRALSATLMAAAMSAKRSSQAGRLKRSTCGSNMASDPPPTVALRRSPIAVSSGRASRKACLLPPKKICSVPARAPLAMPLTGASSTSMPRGPASARTRLATAGTLVDMSTQMAP